MKYKLLTALLLTAMAAALAPAAVATTWYVNGVTGSDSNNCLSTTSACKTIGHAISLAASGDSITVAAATYKENLTINISLSLIGSGASGTIIDGGGINTVVTISSASAHVTVSKVTIRNGYTGQHPGGGIDNIGTLMVNKSTITGNRTCFGGGLHNGGVLAIDESTISGNRVSQNGLCRGFGGGVSNSGTLTLNSSTVSGNTASGTYGPTGGGIYNKGTLMVNSSTISGNVLAKSGTFAGTDGGGIANSGTLKISSSTISTNGAQFGGNLYGPATLQNSIVANSSSGGNCHGTMTSKGYNLSSDSTCDFRGPGDMNDTNPSLGTLGNYGGPTQTIPLFSGSPAIDAGDPNGCTNSNGVLLKTDQRGMPRPDTEDAGGCDMGAFEEQSDGGNCIPEGGACYGPGGNHCCPAPRGHHSYCSNPTGWGSCTES